MNNEKLTCIHQEKLLEEDLYEIFTGKGKESLIVCDDCYKLEINEIKTKKATPEIINLLNEASYISWHEFKGQPTLVENINSSIKEVISEYTLTNIHLDNILTYEIKNSDSKPFIYVLTNQKQIFELQWVNGEIQEKLFLTIPDWKNIDTKEHIILKISDNIRYLAIYNANGRYGHVFNVKTEKIVLDLDRSDYHNEQSLFPVEFFSQEDNDYIIHGTDWNRLDLHNLTTKQLLTEREIDYDDQENYLDYFYGDIYISPNQKWVISTGWVWHPFAMLHCFNLQEWKNENIREPENGESIKSLNEQFEWDQSLVWIDEEKNLIGVWGYSSVWTEAIPAFEVWDINNEKLVSWFVGPERALEYYDNKIYSWDPTEKSISIWNYKTGERIYHNKEFSAYSFHKESQTWFSFVDNKLLALKIIE